MEQAPGSVSILSMDESPSVGPQVEPFKDEWCDGILDRCGYCMEAISAFHYVDGETQAEIQEYHPKPRPSNPDPSPRPPGALLACLSTLTL